MSSAIHQLQCDLRCSWLAGGIRLCSLQFGQPQCDFCNICQKSNRTITQPNPWVPRPYEQFSRNAILSAHVRCIANHHVHVDTGIKRLLVSSNEGSAKNISPNLDRPAFVGLLQVSTTCHTKELSCPSIAAWSLSIQQPMELLHDFICPASLFHDHRQQIHDGLSAVILRILRF